MNQHIQKNRELWNGMADIHKSTSFYDLVGFEKTRNSLKHIELEELGDVAGKSLLHLQCHMGQDTLSWAQRGAAVTGVDLSDQAIATARDLAQRLELPAQFIRSNLYDLPEVLDSQFDLVFTSYGVLMWLPDIKGWAALVNRYLKPGGTFYIVEFHPFMLCMDDAGERLTYGYFYKEEPQIFEQSGTYAAPDADFQGRAHEWAHTLADIISALTAEGLQIEFLHEFPYSTYHCFPFLKDHGDPERFYHKDDIMAPMMFSIRAHKPA